MAAYGQASNGGQDSERGLDYVRELLTEHVRVQDKSGREALQNFLSGNGDVLISYEYEATTARRKGEDVEYVVPADTIEIEIDIALTKSAPPAARALLDYILSAPAQERFAGWGYRPVDEQALERHADRFPKPAGLFTIDDLGGWEEVNEELFDPADGSIAEIEEDAGVSSAK